MQATACPVTRDSYHSTQGMLHYAVVATECRANPLAVAKVVLGIKGTGRSNHYSATHHDDAVQVVITPSLRCPVRTNVNVRAFAPRSTWVARRAS